MERQLSNKPIPKSKPAKLVKFNLLIISALLVAQVLVSNRLATAGEHLSQTEAEIVRLQGSNIHLKNEVASASAMLTLKQKAQNFGFSEPAAPIYFSQEFPVALEMQP